MSLFERNATESAATAGTSIILTPEIIEISQLRSILKLKDLTIRITKIDNRHKSKSDEFFKTIPVSDTIFYQYDINYGENTNIYCINKPDSDPNLYKKMMDQLSNI
jgi:hypothetical protein